MLPEASYRLVGYKLQVRRLKSLDFRLQNLEIAFARPIPKFFNLKLITLY